MANDPLIQAGNTAAATVAPAQTGSLAPATSTQPTSTQSSTTPTVMSPTQAFNNTPTPVPTVSSPDQSSSIVGGAQQTAKSLQDYITQLTPQPTELDSQNQGLLDQISQLTGQDTGKAQAQIDANQASGATQDKADLTALNNQLLSKTAQYNQLSANLGGNGSVETSAVMAAQQAGLRKAQAADIGLVTAQIQAKQGDLTLAQDTANRAVDAKYSTIEDQIKTKQAQLQAIQPLLDRQQKTQSLAQQQVLQDQAQALQDKKDNEKQLQSIALQAAQNGASQGIITQITNAKDPNTAMQLATPYLAKAETQVVEVNGHSLLIDSKTGKTLQDLGTSNSIIQARIAHAGSTPDGTSRVTNANGQQIQIPTALAPYSKTSFSGIGYVDLSSLSPTDKAKLAQVAAQNGIQPILNTGDASKINAISDAKTNLQNIQDSVNNITLGHGGLGVAYQGIANSAAGFFGNTDVKSFNAWRTSIINNVQALAGGAGSGLRINKAEIDAAMQNDMPVITGKNADTAASATAKLDKLNTQLDVWEKQLLGGGNTAQNTKTISIGGQSVQVGSVITNSKGQKGIVNADGTITPQ